MTKIQEILFQFQDEKYGDFITKLVPTEAREKFIGVRSPEYKKIIRLVNDLPADEIKTFMQNLPHQFHEENALHMSLINGIKNYDDAVTQLENFMPYVTNWAVSDSISPKAFEKNKDKLIVKIKSWIEDDYAYTKRIAMLLIKKYFLDEEFSPEYLEWAAKIRSEEYYVNMMTAWLFADALVAQWDSTIPFIQQNKLDDWTHNKAIQKARESFRITAEQKEYLKSLKKGRG